MAVLTAPAHSTVWFLPERSEVRVRQAIRENGPLSQSVNLLKKDIFTTEKFTKLLGGLCQISPYRQQSFDYSVVKYLLLLWLQDYRSSRWDVSSIASILDPKATGAQRHCVSQQRPSVIGARLL
jgi:hypothetical protein